MADEGPTADHHGSDGAVTGDGGIEPADLLAAHHSGDHVLALYISAFNEAPGSHLDVTVFSGGFAFSGRLVGASTYFDAVAERVDNPAIAVPFRKLAADHREATCDGMDLVTTYVHLLDVSVFGGAKRLGQLEAWRGRLSQISGWTTERIDPKR